MDPKLDSRATRVYVEGGRLVVDLNDGRTIAVPLDWFPRLASASSDQLRRWRLIASGEGIHWPEVDEDLSIEGLLRASKPEGWATREVAAASAAYSPWRHPGGLVLGHISAGELRAAALQTLGERVGDVHPVAGTRAIYVAGRAKLNLRTAARKNENKFWFDVTPTYYQFRIVDFFMYVCGEPDQNYIFSAGEMGSLAEMCSIGGSKRLPNFTLHADSGEFEPAGSGGMRIDVRRNRNAFDRIREFTPAA